MYYGIYIIPCDVFHPECKGQNIFVQMKYISLSLTIFSLHSHYLVSTTSLAFLDISWYILCGCLQYPDDIFIYLVRKFLIIHLTPKTGNSFSLCSCVRHKKPGRPYRTEGREGQVEVRARKFPRLLVCNIFIHLVLRLLSVYQVSFSRSAMQLWSLHGGQAGKCEFFVQNQIKGRKRRVCSGSFLQFKVNPSIKFCSGLQHWVFPWSCSESSAKLGFA